ncbi:unnamed protein product [Alopecurus aequalis]
MAVVAAGGLPPLLPTPTSTSCVVLSLRPAWCAPRRFEDAKKPAGRASSSNSWISDKFTGVGVSSADRNVSALASRRFTGVGVLKMPGRASKSTSWVDDKELGRTGTWSSSVERAGRPISSWKRPASRDPSVDRSEKKPKPVETEAAAPANAIVMETETEAIVEKSYAGPSFAMSPDPSELPLPWLFILPRYDCMTA